MSRLCLLAVAVAAMQAPSVALAGGGPIVVVIHGIGGPRSDGWSREIQKQWGVKNVREVTFGYRGRNWRSGMTDFAKRGGQWALTVQRRLRDISRRNPTRKIMVVAHSWGTVATKIALSGGQAGQRVVDPLRGVRISRLVTLGSPLGLAPASRSGGVLGKLGVRVQSGRPSSVGQWVNAFDPSDPVSKTSWSLRGAINKRVFGSGSRFDPSGISHHTGIWTNPWVTKFVRQTVRQLGGGRPHLAAKAPIDKDKILRRLTRLSPKRLHATLRQSGVSNKKLRCLCTHVPHGNVGISYSTKPEGGSPSCKDLSNGPCVLRGFGCYRRPLPTSAKALRACEIDRSVALRIGTARHRAGHRDAWAGSGRRPAPKRLRIEGSYKVGRYTISFRQVGNRVFGTYRGGRSSMTGILRGNTVTGTFRYNRTVHGTFRYTFSADGSTFSGPWKNATDRNRGIDRGRRL